MATVSLEVINLTSKSFWKSTAQEIRYPSALLNWKIKKLVI